MYKSISNFENLFERCFDSVKFGLLAVLCKTEGNLASDISKQYRKTGNLESVAYAE